MSPGVGRSVPHVTSVWSAVTLAQAKQPFLISHDLAANLDWGNGEVADQFRACPLARNAKWHALLTLDGVVGYYDRTQWTVEPVPNETDLNDLCVLQWKPLCGQPPVFQGAGSLAPRHFATKDTDLEEVLGYWSGKKESDVPFPKSVKRKVYLRGTCVPRPTGDTTFPNVESVLRNSIFEELQATCCFGSEPFRVTFYASQAGLQTNLHADEHSGFLIQIRGFKRVVLFNPKASRRLRCSTWGDQTAPVSRRSWFDSGVPDVPGWADLEPFAGLEGREIEVGPGEALFIPKGHFHDVLSRNEETLGLVLRCTDNK